MHISKTLGVPSIYALSLAFSHHHMLCAWACQTCTFFVRFQVLQYLQQCQLAPLLEIAPKRCCIIRAYHRVALTLSFPALVSPSKKTQYQGSYGDFSDAPRNLLVSWGIVHGWSTATCMACTEGTWLETLVLYCT